MDAILCAAEKCPAGRPPPAVRCRQVLLCCTASSRGLIPFWVETPFANFMNRTVCFLRSSGTWIIFVCNHKKAKVWAEEVLLERQRRNSMGKGLVMVGAALAIVSLGSLVSDPAEAGGATSAPSKYARAVDGVKLDQVRHTAPVQTADVKITEFSSSSAKRSVSKR